MAKKQVKKKTSKKKPAVKKKDKGGRPSKLPDIDFKMVEELAGFGLIDVQIATILKISRSTLSLWKLKSNKFSDTIKRGKLKADLKVVKSLFKRANGYNYEEVTKEPTFVIKKINGEKKKICIDKKLIVTKIVTKHVIADTIAGIYWTKNRMKKKQGYEDDWKDKQEVEHSGDVGSGRLELLDVLRTVDEKDRKKILSVLNEAINKKK